MSETYRRSGWSSDSGLSRWSLGSDVSLGTVISAGTSWSWSSLLTRGTAVSLLALFSFRSLLKKTRVVFSGSVEAELLYDLGKEGLPCHQVIQCLQELR